MSQNQDAPQSEEESKRIHRREVHRLWVIRNQDKRRAYMKKWYADNAERLRKKFKEWSINNFEHRKAYKKKWAKEHPESVKRSNKKQFEKNKEERREYGRKYHIANRKKRIEYAKAYCKKRYPLIREKLLKQTKEYAQSHPEVRRRCHINYARRYPEKMRVANRIGGARRRARMRSATVSDDSVSKLIKTWSKSKRFVCYYCQKNLPISKLQIDHIVPVSRGGLHKADNVCKCCPSCNPSKGAKPITKICVNGQTFMF